MHRVQIEAAWSGHADCTTCSIRNLALFADLEEKDFELIHYPIDDLQLSAGSSLYHLDDAGDALFTIRSGMVKLVQYLPDGAHRIVRLLGTGCVVGIEAVLVGRYEHAAITLTACKVCRIPRTVIDDLNRDKPRLHMKLMERWHRGLRQADQILTEMSTGNARQRLARLLLRMSIERPDAPIRLMAREDIGALLGVTMETASRTVAEFKRSGLIIEQDTALFTCDTPALERVAIGG